MFGRLAPGATLAGAQAELAAIGQRTALAFPKIYAQLRPQVLPYAHPFVDLHQARDVTGLLATQGLLVSMLVLVCLNVAILVYTRTAIRQAEIGLRTALGASRGRIVAQLFIEAFVLSAVAALAVVVIAALGLRQLATATLYIASELPFWMSFRLSPAAVLYAVVLSVFAAAIVGIVPALQATRRGLQTGLRIAGTGGMRLGKTWTILIIAQVTFAVAILPTAVSSAWKDTLDGIAGLGFAAEEFLSAQLGIDSVPGKRASGTPEFSRRFASRQTEVMRRLEAEPRVSSVTFAMFNPGDEGGARIETEGVAFPSQSGVGASVSAIRSETEIHEVRFNLVDVNFFRVFEVPILGGRGFEPADIASSDAGPSLQNEDSPEGEVVVVNHLFAQRIFGGNALGRRIRYVNRNRGEPAQHPESGRWYEIVGIVSDFPTGVSPGMRDTQIKAYHAVAAGRVQPAAIAIRMRDVAVPTFTQRLREPRRFGNEANIKAIQCLALDMLGLVSPH